MRYFKLLLFLFLLQPCLVFGATVKQFAPQGQVDEQTRVTAQFSVEMVKLGEALAPAPFSVQCNNVGGEDQWVNARTWSWQMQRPLHSGERCQFVLNPGLTALNGEAVTGKKRFEIFAPAPWPRSIVPIAEAKVDEEQAFIISVGGGLPPTPESVEKSMWCEADGVGSRIPVHVVAEKKRQEIFKNVYGTGPEPLLVVNCVERLPPGVKMKLVWGKGIAVATGAKTEKEESFVYTVREPFRASLSCEREKAGAACSPLSDVRVEFTANTDTKVLQQARLITPAGPRSPKDSLDGDSSRPQTTDTLIFPGPFPPETELTLELPAEIKDDASRPLANADHFPLQFRTGSLPPLAKFPGDFGIVELNEGGLLPVTLRNVEAKLATAALRLPGSHGVSDLRLNMDSEVIATMLALEKFESQSKTVKIDHDGELEEVEDYWYPRELSFLADRPNVVREELPKPGGVSEFEVVGIPLGKPGYHVVEIESKLLGAALLATPKPMYVRTTALVTNLAVHLKVGKDNGLIWVTALDTGKPVANADVRVSGCDGNEQWHGKTDDQGRAFIDQRLARPECKGRNFLLASARLGEDYSFVRSDWNQGIEPWRFGVTTWSEQSELSVHTVFDRPLFRPGQTVSMKHIARSRDSKGFASPAAADLPTKLTIRHSDGTEFFQKLDWDKQGSAVSTWQIPKSAKRGQYRVSLSGGKKNHIVESGEFRVGDFRLPAYTGSVQGVPPRQIAPTKVPLLLGLSFLNGGAAKDAEVSVSATLRHRSLEYPGYPDYSFRFYFGSDALAAFGLEDIKDEDRLVLDKQQLTLDGSGAGRLDVNLPEKLQHLSGLSAEMSFTDPNGEVQTIRGSVELWPAAVALGMKVNEAETGKEGQGRVQVVALDTSGKPLSHQQIKIRAKSQIDYSHRRRIVGGFYAYENHTEFVDLGEVCSGFTDASGIFSCDPKAADPGTVHLLAETVDDKGNKAQTGASYWVSGNGDSWSSTKNMDRIDIIPDKRTYVPGETASVQVRTPFEEATALISVEAGGILDTFVQPLLRSNPVIKLPVKESWGPNVFVSVLLVRGRIEPSFFSRGQDSLKPTAMVDLAKPAYRLGLTEIKVGIEDFRLKVEVSADKSEYQPRQEATVQLKVTTPDGKPAPAGSEVAFAAVDQALLELRPNKSWDLLEAMLQERACEVETSTAQSQVIGKRHFGKKALPAGGGGGKAPTRELFDTLLAWNPRVVLDGNGSATVRVPMNDSLSEFKLVGIATSGAAFFGTGSTAVHTRQDLQMISGLPPLVREKDSFQAGLTLRNSTDRQMDVAVTATAGGTPLEDRRVTLPPAGSAEVNWTGSVPDNSSEMVWEFTAREQGGKAASDHLKITQKVDPAVPVTVRQATFSRIEDQSQTPVVLPSGALPGKGGLEIGLAAKLSAPPPGLKRFFNEYPFSCLEQRTSIAVGLHDEKRWQAIIDDLPVYLDYNGLARFFPGLEFGDPTLTAYILNMASLTGKTLPEESRKRMIKGLTSFVEGHIKPQYWSPVNDLLVRKISALEALTRQGQTPVKTAAALDVQPGRLATSALIDWFLVVKRLPGLPQGKEKLTAVEQELRNRLVFTGGRLSFTSEHTDFWWWMMVSGDSNAFRLIEAMLDEPGWQDDLPRLVRGAMERQVRGRWLTTTANAWATVALDKFGRKYENTAVTGITRATLGQDSVEMVWKPEEAAGAPLHLDWPAESEGSLALSHEGEGSPWATVQVLAAVPAQEPSSMGFRVHRTVSPLQEKVPGKVSRGDLWRVTIDVDADQGMSWVVLSDPIPAGAKILGDGDGRDSSIATSGEKIKGLWPAFVDRSFSFFRAYYEVVPKGHFKIDYTVRINNAGQFSLPPTRVEAMYAPDVFGEAPNERVTVDN